ncbi:hypothetical protein HPB52_004939 [Rhipicephalus sanguineus]|uniref:Uncharacterized protein n=1 Tax=Rhipicephalus sanguineus TaxID=34632 RepID=A0A9D4PAL1_RHISA|nr:hypothetical protein HPB52_004939 [Rhipicephalus sanguineus]
MESVVSGISMVVEDTVNTKGDDSDAKKTIVAVCAICCLLLLIGLIVFLLAGSDDLEEVEEDDVLKAGQYPSRRGGPSRPAASYENNYAKARNACTIPCDKDSYDPNLRQAYANSALTNPTFYLFAVSVNELICTVGASAIRENMIPRDALCTYVYYTNVVVNRGNLHAVEDSRSWEAFKNALANLKNTTGGIGFDVRNVTVSDLDATLVDKSLKDLASRRVKHYGVLNVLDTVTQVKAVFSKAKGLLRVSDSVPVVAYTTMSSEAAVVD